MCGCGRPDISYPSSNSQLSVTPSYQPNTVNPYQLSASSNTSSSGQYNGQFGVPFVSQSNISPNTAPSAINPQTLLGQYIAQEFSYTNNPQVVASPATSSSVATIALADLSYSSGITYKPSVSTVSPIGTGQFSNFSVRPTSTYVNICPIGPYLQ